MLKKFDVMIQKTFSYSAIVEAENEEDAGDKAVKLIVENPDARLNDVSGFEVVDTLELENGEAEKA